MAEDVTLISERTQRARKTYRCDDCGWAIEMGESYRRACLVCDGSKYTWRSCACCVSWLATPGVQRLAEVWDRYELPESLVEALGRHDADGWLFVAVAP